MKSRSRFLICLLVILHILNTNVDAVTCDAPFTQLPYDTGSYCAKCDTTCATCSGSSINSCSSCPVGFTINSNTSTCTAPSSN